MIPLIHVEGHAYPLALANVDTDLIIPAAHLKTTTREGLGTHAFEALRGTAGNPFEDSAYEAAPILLALDNFGCGSSREHAAWALADLGIRVVIAPSFSDIFAGNAFKNGIATVALPRIEVERLMEAAAAGAIIEVDLEGLSVSSTRGDHFLFTMDPFRRACLLAGLDEIALTLASEPEISAFEQRVGI
jgi:3-isopropylmalate/(R)-2-methylmalate dehydratase small subunit